VAVRWPRGFRSAAAAAGIKSGGELDFALLATEAPAPWAGAFTRNAAAAPCVTWSRGLLGKPVRALSVNSGNANCCTGGQGQEAVVSTARAVAGELGCSPDEVLVASTGPIGVPLRVELLLDAVPALVGSVAADATPFARAILTTDTVIKTSEAVLDGASIAGVAKGAAMIQPNMATMLAFITTDAQVPAESMQPAFERVVARTFNRISVDACESTNDSAFLLSTGLGAPVTPGDFEHALQSVCADLAGQIVRDAEGGTRVVRIAVSGAPNEQAALRLGRAVAASTLWRAAAHGGDPNWGRVVSALGSADSSLDLGALEVNIGGEAVFTRGEPRASCAKAAAAMRADEFTVECVVGAGRAAAEILSCDLSPAYVRLNAGGTT